jgi:hypothetical protein
MPVTSFLQVRDLLLPNPRYERRIAAIRSAQGPIQILSPRGLPPMEREFLFPRASGKERYSCPWI